MDVERLDSEPRPINLLFSSDDACGRGVEADVTPGWTREQAQLHVYYELTEVTVHLKEDSVTPGVQERNALSGSDFYLLVGSNHDHELRFHDPATFIRRNIVS